MAYPATLDAHAWGPDSQLTDPDGDTWSITQDGQVAENGVADPHTSRVFQLYEDANGNIYQLNADDDWWEWTPGQGYFGWTETGQPFTANPSPDDSIVPKTTGLIFDQHSNFWTISNGKVVIDNVADETTANVVALAYVNGEIWQENNQALWWEKATPGGTWTPGPAPVSAEALMSDAGAFIFRGGSTLSDAQGNVWSITTDGQVVLNGNVDANTAGVIEMAFDGQYVWQENDHDLWWSWQPAAPGNYRGWYPSSGTATVPVPFSPTPSGSENPIIIIDDSHNFWDISDGQVSMDGLVDATTANVIQLAIVDGQVYQENYNGLWWSKATPSDTWTPGAGSPTDPVTGATTFGTVEGWLGGHSANSATDPANWSAGILPTAGMTLLMPGGTMNMRGGDLAGNTLLFNAPGQNGDSPVVNLSDRATLTAGTAAGGSTKPTINVSGTDTLHLIEAFSSTLTATVDLAANSHLITSDSIAFGSLTVHGAAGSRVTLAGNSTLRSVLLDVPQIDGTGAIALESVQSAPGRMEITGAVGRDVSFALSGDPERSNAAGLTINQPGEFQGSVSMAWSYMDLKGLTADSYDIRDDLLTLFNAGKAVAAFHVTTQPVFNAPTSLVVEQASEGVMLSVRGAPGGSDVYQPGGVGTVLPLQA